MAGQVSAIDGLAKRGICCLDILRSVAKLTAMSTEDKKLFMQIQRVGNKFVSLERGLVFQHGQVKLHASEIHLMKTVAIYPDVNATGMAKLLGVTKGAISQTLSRLVKKGVVSKESDPLTRNELKISLTAFGTEALSAFDRQNAGQRKDFSTHLESLSQEDREKIMGFLVSLEAFLNSLM